MASPWRPFRPLRTDQPGPCRRPRETVLTAILRGERVITPSPDEPLEAGDELLFVATAAVEDEIRAALGH